MSTDPKSAEKDCDPNTKHMQSSPPKKPEENNPAAESVVTCPQKISMWKKALNKLRSTGQISKVTKGKAADASSSPAKTKANGLIQLIDADLSHISQEAQDLHKYNIRLDHYLEKLQYVYKLIKRLEEGDEQVDQLNKFRKEMMKVKLTIPSKYKTGAEKNEGDKNLRLIDEVEQSICSSKSKKMPQLRQSGVFETSMELQDFEARYKELDYHVKLCLLCFSIFPQGEIIKKRLMLQWWVVEGFASTEEVADKHFKDLMDKGFIEPVNDNRSLSAGSCRLHPFHRSALIALAEGANLFNFENDGEPTQNFSGSFQACLMGSGLISYRDFQKKNDEPGQKGDSSKVIKDLIQQLEKLHLVMNVNEHILEFIDDWFSKMRNLNFLYLGRWKALATHHIEVEDAKFLKGLGYLKFVKFLSLQGVSNIISLPQSILQLTNLDVLDLRACSNLESIPERIEHLEKLTHLDMSECYLLARMPKGLSKLKMLKVLKGFFVTQADSKNNCTLGDLHNLETLEKLCIYTDWEDFPVEETHVAALKKLATLTKLTITWGVSNTNTPKMEKPSPSPSPLPLPSLSPPLLPPKLRKLDLKCFPKQATPKWLKLNNLEGIELKKLYIRGGKFCDLGQYQSIDDASKVEKEWTVEVLRLKYLDNIEMEWRQLQGLFPKLKYLEKVSCPNLTLFPCDAKGVWTNQE